MDITKENGDVIYTTNSKKQGIDRDGEEFKEALKNGIGYSERYSSYYGKDMIFVAKKMANGEIIRTGVPVGSIDVFYANNMTYYFVVSGIVLILSIALALKLVRIIIDPVKNLEYVSSKIANGDLQTRIEITSNDELGYLGKSFNNMADQLEAKIQESLDKQNRLEAILQCMQSGVIAVDRENVIMLVNPYAKNIFGITKSVVGKHLEDVVGKKIFKEMVTEEYDIETHIKVKSPIRRVLRVKKTSIISAYERIGTVIALQDITEMKRLENMRSQFVANVSHELKTPLTSIKGFAETLKYVEDKETKDKFLGIIDKESERLRRLIDDILVLSNLESNSSEELENIDTDEIIEEVISILQEQAYRKNIKIIFKGDNSKEILGHRDKFMQLAINLIENAVKYSNEHTEIEIKSYLEGKYYKLEVIDQGIGIPKDDLPRVFERFYRVDKSRKKGGTGLGLAIVKHIAKILGGKIEVESELEKGSKFTFSVKHL